MAGMFPHCTHASSRCPHCFPFSCILTPRMPACLFPMQALAMRTQQVMAVVGLEALPLDIPLAHLSDGYKRWVGLACTFWLPGHDVPAQWVLLAVNRCRRAWPAEACAGLAGPTHAAHARSALSYVHACLCTCQCQSCYNTNILYAVGALLACCLANSTCLGVQATQGQPLTCRCQ